MRFARPVGAAMMFTAASAIILAGEAGSTKAVHGERVVDPVAVAEYTFPDQHLTMAPRAAGVLVTLDDGTGYPTRTFVTVPGDGRSVVTGPSSASCRDDGLCEPLVVSVRPGLQGTARTSWLGAQCQVSGGPVQRVRVSCQADRFQ